MPNEKQAMLRQFGQHFLWSSVITLIFGLLFTVKQVLKDEINVNDLNFYYICIQYINAWLGLCAPYLIYQVISYAFTKQFFYLTFFVTWFWVPQGYKHDAKDGVFTGLWMFTAISLGIYFVHMGWLK